MLAASQNQEADALYRTVIESYPEYSELFSRDFYVNMDLETGSRHILARYDTLDENEQRYIEQYIKTNLTNPGTLVQYPHLSQEHKLKQEASLILAAWEELESDTGAGTAFREMQSRVGRHSPFVYWRLFLQALAAYYESRNDESRAILAKIDPASALRQGVRVLSDLLSGKIPDSPAGKSLTALVAGASLADELRELDAAFKKKRYSELETQVYQVLKGLSQAGKYGLRCQIGALYIYKLHVVNILPPIKIYKLADKIKMFAMAMYWTNDDEEEIWTDYLHEYKTGLSQLERALIYKRLGDLSLADRLPELDEMLGFFNPKNLLHEGTKASITKAEEFWEKSLAACPLEETYEQWYNEVVKIRNKQQAERILEKWHTDFPETDKPLLLLVKSLRERQVFKKAISYFMRLEQMARGNPAVENLRNYLFVDDCINYISKGKYQKAEEQLDQIREERDRFIAVLNIALRWVICKLATDKPEPVCLAGLEKQLADFNQPLTIFHIVRRIRQKVPAVKFFFPPVIVEQWQNPDVYVNNVYTLIHLKDPVWEIWYHPFDLPRDENYFYKSTVATEVLRQCLEFFMHEQNRPSNTYIRNSVWQLTANGLKRKDKHLFSFLIYRAVLLDYIWENSTEISSRYDAHLNARVMDCLGAAYKITEAQDKANDRERVKLVIDQLDEDLEDVKQAARKITDKKLDEIIGTESSVFDETTFKAQIQSKITKKKKPAVTKPAVKKPVAKPVEKQKKAGKKNAKNNTDKNNKKEIDEFDQLDLF
jgi:hypothetical protein